MVLAAEVNQLNRRDVLKSAGLLAATLMGTGVPPARAATGAFAAFDLRQQVGMAVALPPLAVIALNRLAFGPRPGDAYTSLDAFNALPGADDVERLTNFVDQQLSPNFAADTEVTNRLAAAAANLPSLNLTPSQLWATYQVPASVPDRVKPVRDVRTATLIRALYSRWQLFEVLADFWHNHFSIYAWDYSYAGATWGSYDRDVIRANTLGNFYNLLVAVAQSTAMLYYLDNFLSRDDGPNENWARELFELHTLGAENYLGVQDPPSDDYPGYPGFTKGYVDRDVYGATSSFTGWRINNGASGTAANNGTFQYYDAWHWPYGPIVLRQQIPDYDGVNAGFKVLRLVADHPGTARFICHKLCRRLIGDHPPDTLVEAAAIEFYNRRLDSDQIKQVVRFIVLSNEFRTTWGEKIKRPHEAIFSVLRGVNANLVVDAGGTSSFWSAFDQIGQPMFGRRSPEGYPDVKEAWMGTTSLLYRWRLTNGLMENSYWSATSGTGLNTDLTGINVGGANTPNSIADFWINRLLGRPMDDATHRAEVVKIMQGWSSPSPTVTPVYGPDEVMSVTSINTRLKRMVAVICMSPEFQWR